jgi:hypothetical protein
MISPRVGVRVPGDLVAAARSASPELESLSVSELLRAGLAMLASASHGHGEAVRVARMDRTPHHPNGGRPPKGAAAV